MQKKCITCDKEKKKSHTHSFSFWPKHIRQEHILRDRIKSIHVDTYTLFL